MIKRIIAASLLIVLMAGALMVLPRQGYGASASSFHPGNLIDDSKFTDKNTMGMDVVQAFLRDKFLSVHSSCQAGYTCLKDYSENGKSAAQIIWETAQMFSINPQTIIVLLEKEQGLVTDDWPTSNQYLYATGYCRPDGTPPPGCSETYGFTNQVYYATKMFRGIMDGTRSPNYFVGNNNILYNPNSTCGSSTVFIENKATAALYTYTPYQPNAAALNNLYGSGDSCSAYGNRNFWRLFTDWFGPPTGEGYVLATSYNNNGDPRQWVLYKGIKRHVPDVATLKAWGLDAIPLAQMTGLQLGSIPVASPLGRLFRPTNTFDVYFADGGKCYRVTGSDMMTAWNFSPGAIQDVSIELGRVPLNSGNLTFSITSTSGNVTYIVDGGSKRTYANNSIFTAWEGPGLRHTAISDDYLQAMGQGPALTTNKARYLGQYYVLNNGKAFMTTDPNVAEVWGTLNAAPMNVDISPEFVRRDMMTRFVRSAIPGDSSLFAVDRGQLYHLSPEHAYNLGLTPNTPMMAVVPSDISTSIPLFNWIVVRDMGGKHYVIESGGKRYFPNSAVQNYWTRNGTAFVPEVTNGFLNLLPTIGTIERGLIGSTPKVFVVDGITKRWIQNPSYVSPYAPIQRVGDMVLTVMPDGAPIP